MIVDRHISEDGVTQDPRWDIFSMKVHDGSDGFGLLQNVALIVIHVVIGGKFGLNRCWVLSATLLAGFGTGWAWSWRQGTCQTRCACHTHHFFVIIHDVFYWVFINL